MFDRKEARNRRHQRIRRKISGSADRPRLAVFRSARHIVAQIIDDAAGRTLVQATSCEKALRGQPGVRKSAVAEAVGKQLAARCVEKGITRVAFDRGGYRFHGRVAALAKGAREGGLKF